MVNTLRITSIVAGLLAIALLSLSTVYAIQKQGQGDPEVAALIDAPSALEVFQKAHQQQGPAEKDKEPTLVAEARKLVYMAPPPTVNPVTPGRRDRNPIIPDRQPPSAKFDLVAINYFPSDSSLCSVLIQDTAHKNSWLTIGDTIGHQVVKDIQAGQLILENNGGQIETMTLPEKSAHHLLAGMDYPDDPVPPVRTQPTSGNRTLNRRPTPAPRTSHSNRAQRLNAVLKRQTSLTPDKVEKLKHIEENISALRERELGATPEEREQNARQLEEVRKIFEDRINSGHLKRGDQPILREPPPPTEEEDPNFSLDQ